MSKSDSVLNYKITLTINGIEYTKWLQNIRIVSSIAAPYQVVSISLNIDHNDVVLNAIYGKNPIKLSIQMISYDTEVPTESVDMELIHLDSKSFATIKPSLSDGKIVEPTPFNIITVPSSAFNAMVTKINKVYIGKTPAQIVNDMVTGVGCTLFMDSEDQNTDVIDQILMPQLTLYKSIEYLDNNFGLFNGASNLGFCQYNNNFYVMNLSKRLKKSQTYTIHHLSTDSRNNTETIQKISDGKNFFTYNAIKSSYNGNAVFAKLSKTVHIILKPENDLYKVTDFDLKKICVDYGAIFKNNEIDFDSSLNNVETYVTNDSGYGNGSTSVSWIVRQIIGMATINFELGKNIPILSLINVGEPVKLITKTESYIPLSGKYLIKSSDITFDKTPAGFTSTCGVTLMRTNKTI